MIQTLRLFIAGFLVVSNAPLRADYAATPSNAKNHWAWKVPVASALPAVKAEDAVRNPIDRFIIAKLAFRMQSHATDVVDIAKETEATKKMYGLDQKETSEFGTRCLLARRMVERGVRFVQLYCGDTNGWDGHSDIEGNHGKLAMQSDKPIAGLLKDLKSRGLLDSTLVVWGGVRPHADERRGHRPRPQPARLLHVDGRRRHQRWPNPRRDR